MKKQTNKQRIIDALNAELSAIYHNATLNRWADDVAEDLAFFDWVNMQGPRDVEWINEGAYIGLKPYNEMQHIKDKAAAFKSEAARSRFLRTQRRHYYEERAAMAECRFNDYGPIYAYGRGGRTLYPRDWAAGSQSFRAKQFEYEDLTAERAAEMLADVIAFNSWVREWCEQAPANYREYCADVLAERAAEYRAEVHAINAEALPLVREVKQAGRAFSPAVCSVLTAELKKLLQNRKDAINSLLSTVKTLKGLQNGLINT